MTWMFRLSAVGATALLITAGSAQTLQPSHQPALKAGSATAATAGPAARVNGVAIPRVAYDAELRRIFPYFSIHGDAIPKEYEADVRNKAINNLINRELLYQEARRRKVPITPAEWQKRISEIQKDYRSKREFDAAMLQYFGTRAAFEAQLRHDMLLDKMFDLEVKRKAVVSPLEVRKYYEAHKAEFVQPESVSFQTISTLFPKDATAADKQAARKRIEDVLPKAKAAKNYEEFGLLAEKNSEDDYRVMMGEHKMAHRGSLQPEFAGVFSMKEGEVSGVIESAVGFHILRLNKHQQRKQFAYADVRGDLQESLGKERLSARNKAFLTQLRKAAKVEILI